MHFVSVCKIVYVLFFFCVHLFLFFEWALPHRTIPSMIYMRMSSCTFVRASEWVSRNVYVQWQKIWRQINHNCMGTCMYTFFRYKHSLGMALLLPLLPLNSRVCFVAFFEIAPQASNKVIEFFKFKQPIANYNLFAAAAAFAAVCPFRLSLAFSVPRSPACWSSIWNCMTCICIESTMCVCVCAWDYTNRMPCKFVV